LILYIGYVVFVIIQNKLVSNKEEESSEVVLEMSEAPKPRMTITDEMI